MDVDNYQFIVVVFDGTETASEALKDISQLKKDGKLKYKDAVAGYKKRDKVKLQQTKEKHGLIGGGVTGLLVGLALGGPIVGAALGTLIGGVAKKGMSNKELKAACENLEADESALFLMVEEADWNSVDAELPEYKGFLYREVVPVEVVAAYEKVSDDYETSKAIDEELEALPVSE